MPSASDPRRDTNTSHKKDKPRERSMNGTLDSWVEPTVAAAKPSFDDHGGAPFGVLEHMQPLGEAPNARVKARVKGDGSRKSVLGRSGVAVETPEGTPGPTNASAAVPASPVKVEPEPEPVVPMAIVDDEDDGDYAPTVKKAKKKRESVPKVVKPTATATPKGTATATGAAAATKIKNTNRVYGAKKLKSVVEEAKKRALDVNKPDLAAAVNEIYLDSLKDAHLTSILENILLQNATSEQTAEFHCYVRKAKKKLRAAKETSTKEAGRSLPEQEANRAKSLPLRSPVKTEPKTEPTTTTTTTTAMPIALPSTERAEPPKPKFSLKVRAASKPKDRPRSSYENARHAQSSKQQSEEVDAMSDVSELTELSEGEDMVVDVPEPASWNGANGLTTKDQAAERGSLGVQNRSLKRSSADAEREDTEDDRELAAKKQKLSSSITREYRYEESNLRDGTQPLRGVGARNGTVVPPKIKLQPNGVRNASAVGSRAVSTDVDSPLSSPALSSRRGTPHVWKGPLKPTGKRAKTKTSPSKKTQAADSDIPRPGGAGRASPIRDDDNEELSENNDFCSACGGSGYLLCCDGCDRSFHFTCLDPPLSQDASELNEPWFCFSCVAKRPISIEQPEQSDNRLFGRLLGDLNKSNPKLFSLPGHIKTYYAGVGEGKNGEFIDPPKTRGRHRPGYDTQPDDYRLKDNKGEFVLCYSCLKSSGRTRPIITCDTCAAHWHLDCLEPPLANAPGRDAQGLKIAEWLCPLHVEHDLRRIEVASVYKQTRKVKLRRPREAIVVETSLSRGYINNGNIDIEEFTETESEDSGIEDDLQDQSNIPKLPAKGIVNDFFARVKQDHLLAPLVQRTRKRARQADYDVAGQESFASRPLRDQQAALFLTQLAQRNPSFGMESDQVEDLVNTLVSEAPEAVLASSEQDSARAKPKPSREALLRLQALLNEALQTAV